MTLLQCIGCVLSVAKLADVEAMGRRTGCQNPALASGIVPSKSLESWSQSHGFPDGLPVCGLEGPPNDWVQIGALVGLLQRDPAPLEVLVVQHRLEGCLVSAHTGYNEGLSVLKGASSLHTHRV